MRLLQAEIRVKIAGPKKEAKPKVSNVASLAKGDTKSIPGATQPKPVKRPGTGKFQKLATKTKKIIEKDKKKVVSIIVLQETWRVPSAHV